MTDPTTPPSTATSKLNVTQQLLHSTVLIEIFDKSSKLIGTGTGFFFGFFRHNDTTVEVIVTNRHVVENASYVFVTITLAKPDGTPEFGSTRRIRLDTWRFHPDANIDLAIIPCAIPISRALKPGERVMQVTIDAPFIPTDQELRQFTPLEDVLVIGYPDGISDTVNNVPVFRRGITATPVYLDFRGEPKFLLDAAIFPGSSGSPVFLFNQGSFATEAGIHFGTRLKLLGVISQVARHRVDGQIVFQPAPTQLTPSTSTLIPNNLGICVKASKILDFERLIVKEGYKPPDGYSVRSNYVLP